MKKLGLVSVASFLFLALSSVTAYLLRFWDYGYVPVLIYIGIVILVASAIIAAFAKKRIAVNVVCCVISSVALGFLIRAWYVFRGFDNQLWVILLVSLACVLYLWFFYLFAHIPFFRKHIGLYVFLYIIASLGGYIAVVATTQTTFVSTFGFYMIMELAFIFAMCTSTEEPEELVRAITISSYTVFIVAIIIIILVLCEGDFEFDLDFSFDGFDLDVGNGKKTKNTNDNVSEV
jgi:hypothetical protein